MTRWKHLPGIAVALAMAGALPASAEAPWRPWQGLYLGLHAGASWGQGDYREPADPAAGFTGNLDGFSGGLYAGYGLQFGRLVVAVEADGALGDTHAMAGPASSNTYTELQQDWTAHLRLRFGVSLFDSIYAPDGHTLFYAAGGLAMTGTSVDDRDPGYGNEKITALGWTVGVGIEQVIDGNLRFRLEYLYDRYASETLFITAPVGSPFAPGYDAAIDLSSHTLRVGLSWQF